MKTLKRLFLYYACLPLDLLIAWPMVLAVRLLWGLDLRWERGVLKCEFKDGSWPVTPGTFPKGFYVRDPASTPPRTWSGTSIGHGQLFGPGRLSQSGVPLTYLSATEVHEDHHTVQAEAAQVAACVGSHVLAAVLWHLGLHWAAGLFGGIWWLLGGNVAVSAGGWVAAWLRSDSRGAYRGSAHEIGAYAVGHLHALRRK